MATEHENKRWMQILGGLFIALSLALYGWTLFGLTTHRTHPGQLQKTLEQFKVDPAVVKAFAPVTPTLEIINWAAGPPKVLLLGIGIAWLWNARRKVGLWAYGVLAVYSFALAGLFGVALYIGKSRHPALPPTQFWGGVIATALFAGLGILFLSRSGKRAAPSVPSETAGGARAGSAGARSAEKRPRARAASSFASCNVVDMGAATRRVWQFDAGNGSFSLHREQVSAPGQPLAPHLVQKTWTSLWQKKLNVAWLPSDDVFLRVAQFPQSSPEETRAMVELQLEKLSPIPVTQAVWSMHALPHSSDNMQTVVVTIAVRGAVEQFLGRLEGEGYLADRLEPPMLDELQVRPSSEDGAWIYPETRGAGSTALVAWWYGGVLQNVDLLTLPPEATRAAGLKEQLLQMAWAGELEGWLSAPPRWHLVAPEDRAAEWLAPLREGLEQTVEVSPPLPEPELASRTARRAVQADPNVGLLPPEFAARYRQQFVDRLWMRGLGAVLGLYVAGLIVYFVAVWVLGMQTRRVETSVGGQGPTYTNTMQLNAQLKVLTEREELKFAALDCWEAVAETMPPGLTLDTMNFRDGRLLSLAGTAPDSESIAITDFAEKLRKYSVKGVPLFDPYKGDPLNMQTRGSVVTWNFGVELKRGAE